MLPVAMAVQIALLASAKAASAKQLFTDSAINSTVESDLHSEMTVFLNYLDVSTSQGIVTLDGSVNDILAKRRAVKIAESVRGVLGVDDSGLKVEPTARERMRRKNKNAVQPDDEIKNALQTSLRADPRVSHYADTINITVEDGVAILEGAVGDSQAKSAAGGDARDIVGVSWVDNELSVRPADKLPDDADTQKGLNAALRWDPLLEGDQIEAAVFNHVAYLNGSVDSTQQKAEAQDDASRTKGVVEVRNQLKIGSEPDIFFYNQPYNDFEVFGPPYDFETFGPPPPRSDAQIKKDIEREFFWSPFVHRDDITVKVRHGAVKLTGTVGTWIGYGEAAQDARKGGALEVINRLKVR